MLSLLLTLVVIVIVLGLLYWAAHKLGGAFGLPAPILAVIDVLIVIVGILLLLNAFGGLDRLRL